MATKHEPLVLRLLRHANTIEGQPDLKRDLWEAAAVIKRYDATLTASGTSASGKDIPRELARLLGLDG